MWVGVAEVLAEPFGGEDSDGLTSLGVPLGEGVEVFVDPVLLEEPVALAGVAGEHPPLEVGEVGHVDPEVWLDRSVVAVDSAHRVDVIQVGDLRLWRGGFPLPGLVIGQGRGEAGVADEEAGRLVVGVLVDGGG